MTNTTATITSRHDVVKALCTALLDGEPEGNLWVILPKLVRPHINGASQRHDFDDQMFYVGTWTLLMATRSMAYRRLHATPDPQFESVLKELNKLLEEEEGQASDETVVEFIDIVQTIVELANPETEFGLYRIIEEYDKATGTEEVSFEDIARHLALALVCAYHSERMKSSVVAELNYIFDVIMSNPEVEFDDDQRAVFDVLLMGLWPMAGENNPDIESRVNIATEALALTQ